MKHYIDSDNALYGFDDDQADLVPKDLILIPDTYATDQFQYLSVKNKQIVFDSKAYAEEKAKYQIAEYEMAVLNLLNSVALSWGYDSIVSAVSYFFSTNLQYKADAEALIAWRDSIWAEAYTIEQGTLPDTAEAFVAMLPAAPTKPTV